MATVCQVPRAICTARFACRQRRAYAIATAARSFAGSGRRVCRPIQTSRDAASADRIAADDESRPPGTGTRRVPSRHPRDAQIEAARSTGLVEERPAGVHHGLPSVGYWPGDQLHGRPHRSTSAGGATGGFAGSHVRSASRGVAGLIFAFVSVESSVNFVADEPHGEVASDRPLARCR